MIVTASSLWWTPILYTTLVVNTILFIYDEGRREESLLLFDDAPEGLAETDFELR